MGRPVLVALIAVGMAILAAAAAAAAPATPSRCMASPALPADFAHLPYVNPDAPKGGTITYCVRRHIRQPQPVHRQGLRTARAA